MAPRFREFRCRLISLSVRTSEVMNVQLRHLQIEKVVKFGDGDVS
jgi:hypothetical protein